MITVFTVVIPSRYASTRLPGKPLQMIAGKPMVQHVWEQACKSSAQRVVVATDDARIVEACKSPAKLLDCCPDCFPVGHKAFTGTLKKRESPPPAPVLFL